MERTLKGEMMCSPGKISVCSRRQGCDHTEYGGSSNRLEVQPSAGGLQHGRGDWKQTVQLQRGQKDLQETEEAE